MICKLLPHLHTSNRFCCGCLFADSLLRMAAINAAASILAVDILVRQVSNAIRM